MYITSLRRVGGSVMLVVPPAILDVLSLDAGAKVGLSVDNGRLVIERVRPHYKLDELLAQCEASADPTTEDREWFDTKPVGNELL